MTDITWHEVKGDEVWDKESRYLLWSKEFGLPFIARWVSVRACFVDIEHEDFWELSEVTHYAKIGEVGR